LESGKGLRALAWSACVVGLAVVWQRHSGARCPGSWSFRERLVVHR
jgi:hypothetical protein